MLKLCETSQTTFANLQFIWNLESQYIYFLILLLYDIYLSNKSSLIETSWRQIFAWRRLNSPFASISKRNFSSPHGFPFGCFLFCIFNALLKTVRSTNNSTEKCNTSGIANEVIKILTARDLSSLKILVFPNRIFKHVKTLLTLFKNKTKIVLCCPDYFIKHLCKYINHLKKTWTNELPYELRLNNQDTW